LDDKSIPSSICGELADSLRGKGVDVHERYYEQSAHTDAILEGPLGGDSRLFVDIIKVINTLKASTQSECAEAATTDAESKYLDASAISEPMVSPLLVQIARYFNPF